MTLIDYTAAFEKRCDELRPGLKDVFSASFVTTFSELAFAVGTPQSPVTDAVMQRFADNLFGGPCTIGDCAVIKRIHFEATTLVMADLRLQVTSGDMSEPLKKLPYVEKIRRINQQQNRITGISHKNEQQPSHSLIDTCFQMVESGALIYIAPSKCSSRDSEIAAESKAKTKQVLTLEQGSLKTSSAPELPLADVGTELKLMFALQRRGLAFDLVNLVSWSVHVEWTNKLYRALMTESASGFHPITLSQLLKADRELFMILASEETGPLKADPGNDPPLDAAIGRLMLDPRVNIHLTPMPKFDKRPAVDIQKERDDKPNKLKKGEQKKGPAQLPEALKGLTPKTKDGKPACWHFNLAKDAATMSRKVDAVLVFMCVCVVARRSMVLLLAITDFPKTQQSEPQPFQQHCKAVGSEILHRRVSLLIRNLQNVFVLVWLRTPRFHLDLCRKMQNKVLYNQTVLSMQYRHRRWCEFLACFSG